MAERPGEPEPGDDRPTFVRPGFQPAVFAEPGTAPPSAAQPVSGESGRPTFLRPGAEPAAFAPGGVPPAAVGGGGMGLPPEDPVRPWPWWVAPVGLAVAFAAIFFVSVLFSIVGAAAGLDQRELLDDYDYVFGLIQDALWIAVAIWVPLMMVRWIRPEHLGLRKRPTGAAIGKLLLLLFAFYLLAAIYSAAAGLDENSNELLQDTGFGDSLTRDVALAILYPIAAPVAEELLFRGVLFKGLRDGFRNKWGRGASVAVAALISGTIFGIAHWGGGQDKFIPVLIALGVLLAIAYEWSGTLYVPIAIHAINNAIATGSSSDPTQPWVYAIIAAGPVLAVLTAMAIGRFVRRLPSEPRATLPPSMDPLPADGPPPAERPPGL